MAHQQSRDKSIRMQGQVGKLREDEKFYKAGKVLPYTIVDPYHRMGIKCKHPRLKGYSYFEPERHIMVDLRYTPLNFIGRSLAMPGQDQEMK